MSWRIIRKNKPAGTDIYTGVLISDYSIVLFDSETDLAGYNAAQRAHGRQGQPVAEYLITDDDLARERVLMAGRIAAARAVFSAPDIDEVAFAKALAPLLPGVSETDLAAAVKDIKTSLPGLLVKAEGAALTNG